MFTIMKYIQFSLQMTFPHPYLIHIFYYLLILFISLFIYVLINLFMYLFTYLFIYFNFLY